MKFLRFRDLKARGIVNNWVCLDNWVRTQGFPRGRMLGPNTRAWTETEVEEWLAARPAPPGEREARLKGAAKASAAAMAAE